MKWYYWLMLKYHEVMKYLWEQDTVMQTPSEIKRHEDKVHMYRDKLIKE